MNKIFVIIIAIAVIPAAAEAAKMSCLEKCEYKWDLCKLNSTQCGCLALYDVCIRDECNADDSFIEDDCLTYDCDWCKESFGSYYVIFVMVILAFVVICLFTCLICYLCKIFRKRRQHVAFEESPLTDSGFQIKQIEYK